MAVATILGQVVGDAVNIYDGEGRVLTVAARDSKRGKWYATILPNVGFFSLEDLRYAVARIRRDLDPASFATAMDGAPGPEYAEGKYREARDLALQGYVIFIAASGVWSATRENISESQRSYQHIQSYERLGVHSCTRSLVQGWVDGGAIIIDYRDGGK